MILNGSLDLLESLGDQAIITTLAVSQLTGRMEITSTSNFKSVAICSAIAIAAVSATNANAVSGKVSECNVYTANPGHTYSNGYVTTSYVGYVSGINYYPGGQLLEV